MNVFQIVSVISQTVIGLIGSIVAYRLLRLNWENRQDTWYRTLRDFHHFFWTDEACMRVRSWLACDAAYEDIREILQKRLDSVSVSKEEYRILEDIDRFAALLSAYKKIEPKFPTHREVSHRLFDDYWLGCLTHSRRSAFRQYIERYFKELSGSLPTK